MTLSIERGELAEVVHGEVIPVTAKLQASGVEYDSREIRGGELFVALKGESAHGHSFLTEVFARGASLALVEDRTLLTSFPERERLVVVDDTLRAFWALATWWRKRCGPPLIAVTGSVGKTTVKELLASILLKHSKGGYALKSFNNHVGVPYTLCRIARDHAWAVSEIGMNRPGEISALSKVALPNVALVNEVQAAHIGAFEGLDGIADEKLSIADGLQSGGSFIVNGDNDKIREGLRRRSDGNSPIFFGSCSDTSMKAEDIEDRGLDGITFTLSGAHGTRHGIRLAMPGIHSAKNAAAAALGALTLLPSLTLDHVVEGLTSFTAPLMRLNRKCMSDGREILDDSYNANPGSMAALIGIAKGLQESGKRVGLVVGEMLELGAFSERYHRELGVQLSELAPTFVIAVGPSRETVLESPRRAGVASYSAEDAGEAAVIARTLPFDILLVKGSRGVGLDRVVKALVEGGDR